MVASAPRLHLHADLGSGPQEAFGRDGLEVTWNVFHAWKQFQQDGDRAALQERVGEIKAQMRPLLEYLLKLWPALWTFAEVRDVEPTNNAAERGLRGAVIYRKLSLDSRSQGGERTIERLLSVDQTCRPGRLESSPIASRRVRPQMPTRIGHERASDHRLRRSSPPPAVLRVNGAVPVDRRA